MKDRCSYAPPFRALPWTGCRASTPTPGHHAPAIINPQASAIRPQQHTASGAALQPRYKAPRLPESASWVKFPLRNIARCGVMGSTGTGHPRRRPGSVGDRKPWVQLQKNARSWPPCSKYRFNSGLSEKKFVPLSITILYQSPRLHQATSISSVWPESPLPPNGARASQSAGLGRLNLEDINNCGGISE